MEQDPELAELIGVGIVQPCVGRAQSAMTMPDAALDDVPPPWRGFLAQLIDRLDAWSSAIGIPERLDGLTGLAAVREAGRPSPVRLPRPRQASGVSRAIAVARRVAAALARRRGAARLAGS